METGKNVRKIGKARRLSLEELAKISSLTKGYLSKIENGKQVPAISTLQNIAKALGVDISDIMDSKTNLTKSGFEIIRANEASKLAKTQAGYSYVPLLKVFKNKYMSPFLMLPTNVLLCWHPRQKQHCPA